MNSIKLHIGSFFDIFNNVVDGFVGNLSTSNSELNDIKTEFTHGKIPSVSQDRKNLKIDNANVYSDYKKAYEEKKEELSL